MYTFLICPLYFTCIAIHVLILNLFLIVWSIFRVFLRKYDFNNTKPYSKIWLVWGILYSLCSVSLSDTTSRCVSFMCEGMVYMRSCDTTVRAPPSQLPDMAVFWPPCNWLLLCVKWSSQDWWQWLAGPSGKCCALSLVWVMLRAYDISGISSVATNGSFLGYVWVCYSGRLEDLCVPDSSLPGSRKLDAVHIGNCIPV